MDRALGGVAAGLALVFVFLAWGIMVAPASLLVKLLMFVLLISATFGVTLVMTTESPLADAVLQPPEALGGPEAAEAAPSAGAAAEEGAAAPEQPRARASARASSPRARREAKGPGAGGPEPTQGVDA